MALPDKAQKRRVRSDCFLPVFFCLECVSLNKRASDERCLPKIHSFPLRKSKPIVGLSFSVLSSPSMAER